MDHALPNRNDIAARVENTVADALNQAQFSAFHLRAMFAAGMGFFTSAYDLFIIGTLLSEAGREDERDLAPASHPSAASA